MPVTVRLGEDDLDRELLQEASVGLRRHPKQLSPKWFYDERGSELFEQITELPEYYPTRAERSILEAHAADVLRATGADTMVELGSGASAKTLLLLDAAPLRRFVAFDVCEPFLRSSVERLSRRYPALEVHGVVGDFERHLHDLPIEGRTVLVLLGGTIGNLVPEQRHAFLVGAASTLAPGDSLLLGTDLVKDPKRLVAAYDDAAGVTAEFNRNLLLVLNDRLGADFEPSDFAHVARWDPTHEWIEMHLRAKRSHEVQLKALEASVEFERDELLRTEISAKFRRDGVEAELAAAGFELTHWWTDSAGDFALSLSTRC
jgi:L-histidine N-alpha-methyltransferase